MGAPVIPRSAMRSARIFFLLPLFSFGGAELAMIITARGLAARGWPVTLVGYGHISHQLAGKARGLPVITLRATSTLRALPEIAMLLRAERPAVVVTALSFTNMTVLLARLMSLTRTKIVVTNHNSIRIDINTTPGWQYRVLPAMLATLYPTANAIVAVSRGIADELDTMLGRNGHAKIIYNPVVAENARMGNAPPHPWLETASDIPVIIAVGRLVRIKDFGLLVKAFHVVRSRRPCRLIILGEGDQRRPLLDLADSLGVQNDFLLPGFIDDVLPWLEHSTVFALTSRYEGFGIALVEAMYCGLPVVATDCPVGPAEILENGRLGRLVPVGDLDALAAALDDAIDNPGDVEATKSRAAMFSERACVDGYDRLLLDLLRD